MKQFELFMNEGEYLTFDEVTNLLSISAATARNWIKIRKISPIQTEKRELLFSKVEIESLINNIKNGQDGKLKSRRNKNFVSGIFIPKTYIQNEACREIVNKIISQIYYIDDLPEDYERIILAEYALKLLTSRGLASYDLYAENCILSEFVKNRRSSGCYSVLIDDILSGITEIENKISHLMPALCNQLTYIPDQDFLGFLYLSLQCLGGRKANGIYYTPLLVVKDAIDNIQPISQDTKLLDPCCGTGNFLMYAYKYINKLEGIYGYDLSPLSVCLTRLNMAIVTKTTNIDLLYKNFLCVDALTSETDTYFNIIVGNPPWGFNFNEEEQKILKRKYLSAKAKTVESFCVFTEYASKSLLENGIACLILPQSLLNVKIHQPIRDYLYANNQIKRIRYWKTVFDGVQCPAMTLVFGKSSTGACVENTEVVSDKRAFTIKSKRVLDQTNWNFDLTDEELKLIEKINSTVRVAYLENNADFALGIVTGDNSTYISNTKSVGQETVLRGSDIYKYKFVPSNNYILFEPKNFQQVAPINFYRAEEKLIYRFICESLVFAYDDTQSLTLNSANILIPKIAGLSIKYIIAVLNSRVTQYYFNHKYKSIKILRAQIENLPIPIISKQLQLNITKKVDSLLQESAPSELQKLYEEIDEEIARMFGLSERDYETIKRAVSSFNPFLITK